MFTIPVRQICVVRTLKEFYKPIKKRTTQLGGREKLRTGTQGTASKGTREGGRISHHGDEQSLQGEGGAGVGGQLPVTPSPGLTPHTPGPSAEAVRPRPAAELTPEPMTD